MTNFQIFNGNENEFDTRTDLVPESREYEVGFSVRFLEFAGQLTRPLPVLASAA